MLFFKANSHFFGLEVNFLGISFNEISSLDVLPYRGRGG